MSETAATVFDGSGMRDIPAIADSATSDEAATFDALAVLRQQVDERDEEEGQTCLVDVPGLGWRLVCDITFPYTKYMEWQAQALPRNQRNARRGPNLLKLNQTDLALNVLFNTCVEIQYERSNGEWETLAGPDGTPLLPTSDILLRKFGVVDPRMFLRRLFGVDREARLVEASQKVAAKAGWIDDDDDESDPTV